MEKIEKRGKPLKTSLYEGLRAEVIRRARAKRMSVSDYICQELARSHNYTPRIRP